jgi:hypothetical protein
MKSSKGIAQERLLPLAYYSHGRGSRIRSFHKISVCSPLSDSGWYKKYFRNIISEILDTLLALFINCRHLLQR